MPRERERTGEGRNETYLPGHGTSLPTPTVHNGGVQKSGCCHSDGYWHQFYPLHLLFTMVVCSTLAADFQMVPDIVCVIIVSQGGPWWPHFVVGKGSIDARACVNVVAADDGGRCRRLAYQAVVVVWGEIAIRPPSLPHAGTAPPSLWVYLQLLAVDWLHVRVCVCCTMLHFVVWIQFLWRKVFRPRRKESVSQT